MAKGYGRKPYIDPLRYPEFIRTATAKQMWNQVTIAYPNLAEFNLNKRKLSRREIAVIRFIKQSELKKPYEDVGSYPSMENKWEGLPGLDFPDRTLPLPDQPWNMQDPEGPLPGVWVLDAFTNDYWCAGKAVEITINGTHPIYNLRFQFPGSLQAGTSFSIVGGLGTPTVLISFTGGAAETGLVSMEAYLEAFDAPDPPSQQGRGWTGFSIPQGSTDECKCNNPDAFTVGSNPDTVAQSTSPVITVVGGASPYDWAVSGTDFTMGAAQTVGLTNTLVAGASACGTAAITVTDFCGQEVEIEVRSTVGRWVNKPTSCVVPGAATSYLGARTFERVVGGKKNVQRYKLCYFCSSSPLTPICTCPVGHPSACGAQIPCGDTTVCVDLVCSQILDATFSGSTPCCSRVTPDSSCFVYQNQFIQYWEWEC